MQGKMKKRFYTSCSKCKHDVTVVLQADVTKGCTIIFNCSECKATNFLNASEISEEQLV